MSSNSSVSPVLEVRSLVKKFGDSLALDGLSLSIRRGEVLGLLGANGAGKTTAMNIILGLTTPDSGDHRVFGLNFAKNRIEILRRTNFTSAYTNLPSNLTVYQNLKVFAGIYGVKNAKDRIEELLELMEITWLKNHVTGHLSAGESTRVGLCKALLNRPELLLLDEPTASLDPYIADKVRKVVNQVRLSRDANGEPDGPAILYTSHNMKDIEEVCDRVMFMHKGKVVYEGTPAEILQQSQSNSLENVFIRVASSGDLLADDEEEGA